MRPALSVHLRLSLAHGCFNLTVAVAGSQCLCLRRIDEDAASLQFRLCTFMIAICVQPVQACINFVITAVIPASEGCKCVIG